MRNTTKSAQHSRPAGPKDIAERTAERARLDRGKVRKSGARASEAADRLLKDLDDVIKHLDRKH